MGEIDGVSTDFMDVFQKISIRVYHIFFQYLEAVGLYIRI